MMDVICIYLTYLSGGAEITPVELRQRTEAQRRASGGPFWPCPLAVQERRLKRGCLGRAMRGT